MNHTYPLAGSQNLHQRWITEYGTQQVSNVSCVASLQAALDFGLLKKCIQMEYDRSECLRLQFPKPGADGQQLQYIASSHPDDIPYKDLSDMTMQEARVLMQQWAYETIDGYDRPMCEITMLKLPDGYDGFYVHADHRLLDAIGLGMVISDIIRLYCHYRFGSEMPEAPASFTKQLEKDLQKQTSSKRFEKDCAYWDETFDRLGEPLYADIRGLRILQESRAAHGNKKMRSADIELKDTHVEAKKFYLEGASAKGLQDFCLNHHISITNFLLLGLRTVLSKFNAGQEDITIKNFISRRSTKSEWTSGGSRTVCFPCRTVISPDTEFLDAAYAVQDVQNSVYLHSNMDPTVLDDRIRERYGTPEFTEYNSVWLTYQPSPMQLSDEHIDQVPQYIEWFPNGAATKKIYLTVSHVAHGQMCFSFHYQTAVHTEEEMELMYYYLMRILFKGIEEPDLTIGQIMEQV